MAKRFTDTNKYKKPFMRGLPGAYKLLWDFLYHDCDHAGIWIVDFDIAQAYLGNDMPVNSTEGLRRFNTGEIRIVELDGGKKWFIPSFIEFQYVKLSEKNNSHLSVITILNKYNLLDSEFKIIPLPSPSPGAMDKDKDTAMVKDKDNPPKKNFNTRPTASDFNGLPEQYIIQSITLVKITSQADITEETVLKFWEVFKIQELTGTEHYHNEGKVYSHFLNVIKKQKFTNGAGINNNNQQGVTKFNAGALELLAKGKQKFASITGQSDHKT